MFDTQRGLQLPLLALVTLGSISVNCTAANSHAVICFFPSWAVYRSGDAFDVEDIDPTLCTHLIYAFAGINDTDHTIMSLDPWNDLEDNGGRGAYKRFTKLKEKNDKLKTLLTVGGWNEGSMKFSHMASTKENRAAFIDSVMTYLETFGFDGLDIDWEYPGQRGGSHQDKANFGLLIQELREVFDSKGYLLTAALPASKDSIHKSYDLPTLDKYLDFMNVMAFGYIGSRDDMFTSHTAPLYACHEDVQRGRDWLNVNFTMHYYLSNGASAAKLIMGIPFYGNGFILQDPSQHGLYAPVSGGMTCSPHSVCGYGELCEFYFNQPGWTHVRDPEQQSIYSYTDQYWIGYDDLKSIQLKSEMIRRLGLAGAMVWSIDLDDTRGVCGVGPAFALLSELYHQMNGPLPSTTAGPTTLPGPTSPHL